MKKNTKKKILTLALVIALLAIAVVGGSLAWFTAEDSATNTFTIGSIEIVQHEKQYDEDGVLEDFEDGKVLLPIVNTENPSSDDNYQDKIVTVENTGKNPAYVQTFVAIPAALDKDLTLADGLLHVYYNHEDEGNNWKAFDNNPDADGVQPIAKDVDIEGNGILYNVYKFVYNDVLDTYTETKNAIEGVYLDATTDLKVYRDLEGNVTAAHFVYGGNEIDTYNAANTLYIFVATQAVQSQGFESAEFALTSAFENKHPWSK